MSIRSSLNTFTYVQTARTRLEFSHARAVRTELAYRTKLGCVHRGDSNTIELLLMVFVHNFARSLNLLRPPSQAVSTL